MNEKKNTWILAMVVMVAALAAGTCGGGSSTPTTPSPTPTPTPTPSPNPQPGPATVTITASGASPQRVEVRAGSRVSFVNNNNRPHDMNSDPHPEHTGCSEINSVGFINPGQTRETATFVTPKTCGFHDHNQPSNESLQGTIVVIP